MTLTGDPRIAQDLFNNPPSNPFILLRKWFEIADSIGVIEPRGFVLSTVNELGKPSSRVVLLKAIDETGLVFTTSQESSKGKDLKANRWTAGTFWWKETIQQVNFTGYVTECSIEQSNKLFEERDRSAQAVSVLSEQSSPLAYEEDLKSQVIKLVKGENKIERPSSWVAYHLTLTAIEFWLGNKDRFHKRLRYDLIESLWSYFRLQP